jgi:hypothetical protein
MPCLARNLGIANDSRISADENPVTFETQTTASSDMSVPGLKILFIDGLPGSGKSTAAAAVGERLPHTRIFLETTPDHPLLPVATDRMGAALADIHETHSWESFAAASFGKLEAFLASAEGDVLYVFESHPIQSTFRVLFQLDAPQAAILQTWSDLQDRLAGAQPRLVYFEESNPLQALRGIAQRRGSAWKRYLIEAIGQSPWMRARGLSAAEGVDRWLAEYAELSDRLAKSWRFPMLRLAARPENYERRTDALIKWATKVE